MIDRNHPAVEAADREYDLWDRITDDALLTVMSDALTAALPLLAADDLRDTPAGRALMAEAWDRGAADNERAWTHAYDGHDVAPDDPLAECQTCRVHNPYREETTHDRP